MTRETPERMEAEVGTISSAIALLRYRFTSKSTVIEYGPERLLKRMEAEVGTISSAIALLQYPSKSSV